MRYSLMCDILTANAESAIEKSRLSSLLPLSPTAADEIVLTHFWVNNFDLMAVTQYGGGAINITTLLAGRAHRKPIHCTRSRTKKIKLTTIM